MTELDRRKAVLMHPTDWEKLKRKVPEVVIKDCPSIGFPEGWAHGLPIYVHKRRQEGTMLMGPEEEIIRMIRQWETE